MYGFKIARVAPYTKQFWERSEASTLTSGLEDHTKPCSYAHCTLPAPLHKDYLTSLKNQSLTPLQPSSTTLNTS